MVMEDKVVMMRKKVKKVKKSKKSNKVREKSEKGEKTCTMNVAASKVSFGLCQRAKRAHACAGRQELEFGARSALKF